MFFSSPNSSKKDGRQDSSVTSVEEKKKKKSSKRDDIVSIKEEEKEPKQNKKSTIVNEISKEPQPKDEVKKSRAKKTKLSETTPTAEKYELDQAPKKRGRPKKAVTLEIDPVQPITKTCAKSVQKTISDTSNFAQRTQQTDSQDVEIVPNDKTLSL